MSHTEPRPMIKSSPPIHPVGPILLFAQFFAFIKCFAMLPDLKSFAASLWSAAFFIKPSGFCSANFVPHTFLANPILPPEATNWSLQISVTPALSKALANILALELLTALLQFFPSPTNSFTVMAPLGISIV